MSQVIIFVIMLKIVKTVKDCLKIVKKIWYFLIVKIVQNHKVCQNSQKNQHFQKQSKFKKKWFFF